MSNKIDVSIESITQDYIGRFCDLILVFDEKLDLQKATEYIHSYIQSGHALCAEKSVVRHVVHKKILDYISKSRTYGCSLFEFANENEFNAYRTEVEEKYTQQYLRTNGIYREFPQAFSYMFEYIQEVIDSHILFDAFSVSMIDQASKYATNAATESATSVATEIAQDAVRSATDNAIRRVNDQISKKTSETSVTILGIFAGIVLTVVAGLIYSSSVLNNINSASIEKLVLISSLVGLVCFNIIHIMFHYIDKFRIKPDETAPPKSKSVFTSYVFWINFIFIAIMIVSGICYKEPTNVSESPKADTNINVQISESQTNDAADDTSDEDLDVPPADSELPDEDLPHSGTSENVG